MNYRSYLILEIRLKIMSITLQSALDPQNTLDTLGSALSYAYSTTVWPVRVPKDGFAERDIFTKRIMQTLRLLLDRHKACCMQPICVMNMLKEVYTETHVDI